MRVPFTAGPDDHDRRLETVVRRLLPHLGLGALQKALRQGDIRVNGTKAPGDRRVVAGDTIEVWEVLLGTAPAPTSKAAPPLPPAWVVWQNDDLLVINKPSGLVVHRGDGPGGDAPLDDRVRAALGPSTDSLSFRPGPLHRLDRETSGLIVFSKTLVGARTFSSALEARQYTKTYLAVLAGRLEAPAECRAPLARDGQTRTTVAGAGDAAVTRFGPRGRAPGLTLVEVDLGTGRTHQIRAHAQTLGYPLAGDQKYGGGAAPAGLPVPFVLHAWKISGPGLPDLVAPLEAKLSAWVEKTFKFRG